MKIETRVVNDKSYKSLQVTRLDTRGKIMDVQDLVTYSKNNEDWNIFEKVAINVTEYGEGKKSTNIRHFCDLDDFLLLAKDLADKKEVNFKDYKGSKSDKYSTGYEARVLVVESWAEGGRGAGAYKFTFTSGPGTPGDKGQVSLVRGAEVTTVTVTVSIQEARKAFLYAYNYFNNKQTAFLATNWKLLY